MSVLAASCPNCAGPIEFKAGSSIVLVCPYCRSAVARNDRALEDLGKVAEIVAVSPGERGTGYATTHVFAPGPDGTAVPVVLPDEYRALAAEGFDLPGYVAAQRPYEGGRL